MNKILANMMMTCSNIITDEQIEELQTFIDHPMDFDSQKEGFPELLNFDLDNYKPDESQAPEQ